MLNPDECHDYLLFRLNNLIVAIAIVTMHNDLIVVYMYVWNIRIDMKLSQKYLNINAK